MIVCDRPIEESIESLICRTKATELGGDVLASHQRWLGEGRDTLADEIPDQALHVSYAVLLRDPAAYAFRPSIRSSASEV